MEGIGLRAPSVGGFSLRLEASLLEPPITCHSLVGCLPLESLSNDATQDYFADE